MWNLKHSIRLLPEIIGNVSFLSYSQCKDNFVLAPSEDIRRPQGFNMDLEKGKKGTLVWNVWSLSWWKPVLFRNQSIDLQSESIEWFLYDASFRHERDKYEFHHRFSNVILIDAIQNKRQRMNVSTIQALRFDKLNLNLSKTTVSFWMLQFLISRKGKNLFNLNESMVPFLKAGIWNWRLLKGHTYLNIEKTIRYNSFKCFFTGFNAGIKWFQWN